MGKDAKSRGTVGVRDEEPGSGTTERETSCVCWEGCAQKDPGEVCSQACNCGILVNKAGALQKMDDPEEAQGLRRKLCSILQTPSVVL